MTRAQDKCFETTVTMAYKVWNEISWMNEWIWDETSVLCSWKGLEWSFMDGRVSLERIYFDTEWIRNGFTHLG